MLHCCGCTVRNASGNYSLAMILYPFELEVHVIEDNGVYKIPRRSELNSGKRKVRVGTIPFSLNSLLSGDRIGLCVDGQGWLYMKHNGAAFPPVPLSLPAEYFVALQFPVSVESPCKVKAVPNWLSEQDIEMAPEDKANILRFCRDIAKRDRKSEDVPHTECPKVELAPFLLEQFDRIESTQVTWRTCGENFRISDDGKWFSSTKSAATGQSLLQTHKAKVCKRAM